MVTLDLSSTSSPGPHLLKIEKPDLKLLVQNLTELKELYLDGVDISSNRYNWSQAISSYLPNLSVLSLFDCSLSGPIDDSLMKLKYLSVIRLDQNTFSCPFPVFFTRFNKLSVLSLSSCDLYGVFPQMILQLPSLHSIDVSNNRLLEGSIGEFPHNGPLQNLVISYTKFSGKIPNSVGDLRMLSRIELRACNFSGPIPNSMSKLSQLVYLDFSGNGFTSSIPSYHLSKNLTLVNFYNNALTGEIPSSYWEGLNYLEFLNLGNNFLSGHVPVSLFSLPSLWLIDLSNNQFSGQINEISNLSSSLVDTVDLSGNKLEGPTPKFFFEILSLASLSLSSNNFSGVVELSMFGKLQNLDRLDLSHNKFSVNLNASTSSSSSLLPQFGSLRLASCKLQKLPDLKNQSRLMTLDLSENQITGEIPSWIWESGNGFLRFLNLSHNLFTDLQEPYHFHRHDFIDLHSNKLHGKIPIPPPSAAYVDYSSNNFASSIPDDIGNHLSPAFYFFSVSSNKLVGTIPQSLCNASGLQVLDLSNNSLHGKVPSCLTAIKTLGVLNLQGNKGLCGAPLNTSCNNS